MTTDDMTPDDMTPDDMAQSAAMACVLARCSRYVPKLSSWRRWNPSPDPAARGADVDASYTTRQVGDGPHWKERRCADSLGCCCSPLLPALHRGRPRRTGSLCWSAAIDAPASAAITGAAQWAKDHPDAVVKVIGYADPTGSGAANENMSHTRAQVVADQLVTDGVDRNRIGLGAEGATGFALTSQESRRVEIVIGGP
jgi:hypothetical protein